MIQVKGLSLSSQLATQPSAGRAASRTSNTLDSVVDARTLDTTMRVTTPENIAFEYEVVGPFRRLNAYALDVLISVCAYSAIAFVTYFLGALLLAPILLQAGMGNLVLAISGIYVGAAQVGYFFVYWFYGVIFETYYNGQTIGKRIAKMRVISTDGHAIDGVQATLRNFFRLLDIMPLVSLNMLFETEQSMLPVIPTFLYGLVVMLISPKFQRVGDLVAGTVVVNEEKKQLPDLAKFKDERIHKLAEMIPASFVPSSKLASVLAEYVDQRRFLAYARASEIASHLAKPLLEKFGMKPDTDFDLFLCALYFRTFSSVGSEQVPGESEESSVLPPVELPSESEVKPSLADQKFQLTSPVNDEEHHEGS